jgi:hypothetical protein
MYSLQGKGALERVCSAAISEPLKPLASNSNLEHQVSAATETLEPPLQHGKQSSRLPMEDGRPASRPAEKRSRHLPLFQGVCFGPGQPPLRIVSGQGTRGPS